MRVLRFGEVKGPAQKQQPRGRVGLCGTQSWGLEAAAARPGQALQDQLSPAPSEGVSYKEKEKAFLIRVLFPLLLWASQALEGGCLWAGSAEPVHGQKVRVSPGLFPAQQSGPHEQGLPWSDLSSVPSQPGGASTHYPQGTLITTRHLLSIRLSHKGTSTGKPSVSPSLVRDSLCSPSSLPPCPTAATPPLCPAFCGYCL